MNKWDKADYYTIIILKLGWPLLIILIILVGVIRSVMDETDPLDRENLMTKKEIIGLAEVRDTVSHCGFDVVYSTKKDVTKRRGEEIRSRPHVKESIKRLERDAPLYFGNMLYTDIYDFAGFAKKYDSDPDVEIQCIWVEGVDKCRLYIGENPKIKNSANWYNPNTRQGVLYIKNIDVYKRCEKSKRVYRYWKCRGLYEDSNTDEHFSHFSEDERID